ncbi:hypothetical protein SASPL_123574 [Salvia splendens]|uniref:Small subunit ribosomal protein S6 n=1 Tax=Salvia splendens TaxID=180675 RepID=A0A8X8XQ35_SALSN|nr:hypothetical protein SASPL_123574 [Salvia splendens]
MESYLPVTNAKAERRSKSKTVQNTSKSPLLMGFLSCLAWLYVAGRLWQDPQNRTLLAGLLKKNSGQKTLLGGRECDIYVASVATQHNQGVLDVRVPNRGDSLDRGIAEENRANEDILILLSVISFREKHGANQNGGSLVIRNLTVVAKKENKPKKKRKDDSHSFASTPDEATGPYPEAVLLKQRSVEEDGRLMPEFADVEERELFEALNLLLESDTNVDQMRHYEVVYLIHEDYKDEVENVNTKVRDFLEEKKGKVWRFGDWGMRRLAYKIKKAKNAHYILMNFEVEAQWINEFKSMLDRDERVIRHLVMKRDEAETEDCLPPPEFSTLRADMVDDDTDEEEEEEEEYDDEEDEQAIHIATSLDDDIRWNVHTMRHIKQLVGAARFPALLWTELIGELDH